jgi:hypothetical protein
VSLVEIEVGAVLLLEGDDLRQSDDGPLHRVDAFHHDEDLLPGSAGSRVTPDDGLTQDAFQAFDIAAKKYNYGLG